MYQLQQVGLATSNLAWRRNQIGGLAWLERPQVAMHSQLPRFLVTFKSHDYKNQVKLELKIYN